MNALQTSRSPIDVDFTVESSTALNHKVHLAEIDCALTSNQSSIIAIYTMMY